MRVEPTPERPPWPYAGTSLDGPAERPTFALLARRLARFDRDGLIQMGTRVLWFMWQHDVPMDRGNVVTRFATPWLIALSCVYGGRADRPRPSEQEFRLLCWELHGCAEPSSRDLPEASVARLMFKQRYDALPADHPLRRMPRGALDHIWADYMIGLAVQSQARPFAYMPSDLVRPFVVYERMREKVTGEGRDALRALEQTFFGVPWEHFLRGYLVTMALTDRDARGAVCPGVLAVEPEAPPLGASLGVQPADLQLVLERLSTRLSVFRDARAELEALPEHARKHSATVRRLDTRPTIVLDDDGQGGVFRAVIPSPWHARSAVADFVLDEFVAFAASHASTRNIGGDPWSLRGEAFHAHLDAALAGRSGVISIDRFYEGKTNPPSHPDLLWLGERFGILIEAKIRLTPNSDSWAKEPTSLFDAWRRGAEALDQCVSYLQRGADGHAGDVHQRQWLAVIVTLQTAAAETTSFRSLVKRWNLLAASGLSGFAVVSAAELEHFVLEGDADRYAESLLELWDALEPDSLVRADEGVRFVESRVSAPIAASWERLLPGLRPMWATPT